LIDLTKLYSGTVDELSFDGEYVIPQEMITDSRIISLDKVIITNSKIKKQEEYEITLDISGRMKINDSITLEEVWYPFNIQIEEKLDDFVEKDKKALDLLEFLWQNIVLEVPLRYTLVSDYKEYCGDGWKLVSEEELDNNPFRTLLNNEDRSD
jgi:uncharacterized metal-binding protein YceD (DUF177 family)